MADQVLDQSSKFWPKSLETRSTEKLGQDLRTWEDGPRTHRDLPRH